MSIQYTKIVEKLPSSVPFVGPEAQERNLKQIFKARIGANESVFGPSLKATLAMQNEIIKTWKYGDPENFDLKHALAKKHMVEPKNIVVEVPWDGCRAGQIASAPRTEDCVGCKRCETACPTDFLSVRVYLGAETTRSLGLAY